jgi:carbamate kinase
MTVAEARVHQADGQFPPGSMGPKIDAALRYLRAGGHEVIITSIEKLHDALEGKAGTRIVP